MSPRPPGGPRRTRAARREPSAPPPPPSREAFAALGPYARTRLTVRALGLFLALDVPADVFSTQRIDEGTLLLLAHLPEGAPGSLLDLGCGYGALGLPVAARFPQCRAILVDRDLLAVAAAAHNARALGLHGVTAVPSLGYRDLAADARFDWVLCNVPARIGQASIGHLLEGGQARLSAGGALRVVVIRDLEGAVEAEAARRGLAGLALCARGPRHTVYALPPRPAGAPLPPQEGEIVYARDRTLIAVGGGRSLELARPHDASEDPARRAGLSLLFEALPHAAPSRILSFRCGYGAVPLSCRARYQAARVTACDRDLLDTAFLRLNAAALGLAGPLLEVREALWPEAGALVELALAELSPSAGPGVATRELALLFAALAPGGQALVLASEKQEREWFPAAWPPGASGLVLVRRGGWALLRLSRARS